MHVSSTKRVWRLDESSLFQGVLLIFVAQYCFGFGTFIYHNVVAPYAYDWFDGFFLGLNAAILVTFVVVLRLQEKHYEIDDGEAEEVLRIVNWMPLRYFSVSGTYPLSSLVDVTQVVHKGDVVVKAVFGTEDSTTLFLSPDDQESFVRALSLYLPYEHPNRGIHGVACVAQDAPTEFNCSPLLLCIPRLPAILTSRATEATYTQLKTGFKALLVWLVLLAGITTIHATFYTSNTVWLVLFCLDTLVCLTAAALWNMGNVAMYRIYADKLVVASSRPFVCTEGHHFNYFASVQLISGTETLRMIQADAGRIFVLGKLPCEDTCAQENHIFVKRKTGLLDLVLTPENATRFAEILACQVQAHQQVAV